ncbi:MAG: hypothetical protein ACLFP2_04815 [Candidatus Woesearchaeota archaeon]
MRTSLDEWIEKEHFIIADGRRYLVLPYEGDKDFLFFYGSRFAIEDAGDTNIFDQESLALNKDYMSKQIDQIAEDENLKLSNAQCNDLDIVEMIIKQVHPSFRLEKKYEDIEKEEFDIEELSVAKKVLDNGMFSFNEALFKLVKGNKANEYIRLHENNYQLLPHLARSQDLRKTYVNEFKRQIDMYFSTEKDKIKQQLNSKDDYILEAAKKGSYEEDDFGFTKKGNAFYVYAKTGRFALYEPTTKEYFQFPSASVAVRVKNGKTITWDDPIIMEPYSHPGIQFKDTPEQKICASTDREEYERYRKMAREDPTIIPKMIGETLRNGYNQVINGYISAEKGNPWHVLTEDIFEHMKTSNPWNVTNEY